MAEITFPFIESPLIKTLIRPEVYMARDFPGLVLEIKRKIEPNGFY